MLKSLLLTYLLVLVYLVYTADQACVGKQLLPVNDENFTILKRNVRSLSKHYFGVPSKASSLHNNGKTVIIKFIFGKYNPYIGSGPYGDDNYKLEFMYFNWLRENYTTQEILPLELHAVFVNLKYKSFEEAVRKNFGLTVWSFKYNSVFRPTPNLLSADVFDALKSIREPNTRIDLSNPREILPSVFDMIKYSWEFYMYQGRLTSTLHQCSGDVIWLEFPTSVQIESEEYENIKSLLSFNNTSLMEQFHDSIPPNGPIYESVENNLHYDTDFFNATSVEPEGTLSGSEIKSKKCIILGIILVICIGIIF